MQHLSFWTFPSLGSYSFLGFVCIWLCVCLCLNVKAKKSASSKKYPSQANREQFQQQNQTKQKPDWNKKTYEVTTKHQRKTYKKQLCTQIQTENRRPTRAKRYGTHMHIKAKWLHNENPFCYTHNHCALVCACRAKHTVRFHVCISMYLLYTKRAFMLCVLGTAAVAVFLLCVQQHEKLSTRTHILANPKTTVQSCVYLYSLYVSSFVYNNSFSMFFFRFVGLVFFSYWHLLCCNLALCATVKFVQRFFVAVVVVCCHHTLHFILLCFFVHLLFIVVANIFVEYTFSTFLSLARWTHSLADLSAVLDFEFAVHNSSCMTDHFCTISCFARTKNKNR